MNREIGRCKGCFFSEISMRSGADIDTTPKLWCWLRDYHVSKNHNCGGWLPPNTEGDPRKVAEHYQENSQFLRRFLKRGTNVN